MKLNQLAGIGLLTLLAAACTAKEQETKPQEDLPLVQVVTVHSEAVPQNSEYTATVEAFKTNNIASSSGNRIKRILVDVGSTVRAGQSVVILDDVNIVQQQIAIANQKRDLDRAKELVRIGGGTQQTADQLQAQYDANVRALRTMQENTVLTSPVSGVVTAKNYDAGDLPGAMPILVIEQQQPLKVIVNVNEGEYPNIKLGMPVDVRLDTYGDEVFAGRVHLIHPSVDPASRTFQVEVTIANSGNRIRTGMFARVTFDYGIQQHVVVADRAIQKQTGSGVRYVFVYNPTTKQVAWREVQLGQRIRDRFEVVGGLNDGEQVVLSGQSRLADGAQVKLQTDSVS